MSLSALIQKLKTSTANVEYMEFAGTATSLFSGPSSRNPTTDWIVDTGATSHMTPHKHWFHQYTPKRVPVRLANNYVIYSEGIGTVCFEPLIQGNPGGILEFYNVLHVPQLRNNLLSALYLSMEKSYIVIIDAPTILFMRNDVLNFTATIHPTYSATMDGRVVSASPFATAAAATTYTNYPMDWTLWHRRFGHLHHAAVRQIHNEQLVEGMAIRKVVPMIG